MPAAIDPIHQRQRYASRTSSRIRRLSSSMPNGVQQVVATGYSRPPWGLKWRSNTAFIVVTIGVGIFTDLFLYGLIVPVVPFMLEDKIGVPQDEVQSKTSMLLAVYAAASLAFCPIAGWLADKASSRQLPFLCGLVALLLATVLFGIGRSVAVLAIARILQGLSGAVVWTIGLAMCLETVGPDKLGVTIGSIFSIISVGTQASPTIGGLLYEKAGLVGVFGLGVGLLVVDFILRLFVVEKKIAAKYGEHGNGTSKANGANGANDNGEPDEESPLLGEHDEQDEQADLDEQRYRLPEKKSWLMREIPILACIGDRALLAGLWLGFAQAAMFGSLDATIPTVAKQYYGFHSLRAGLLFIASGASDLLVGPIAGWCVDRFGTKPVATLGCLWLTPAFVLLRLPQPDLVGGEGSNQVKLWAGLLAIVGIGMGVFGAPSIVEAGAVVEKYHKANPDFFGENGPYAQLYGLNGMSFNAGLMIGPLIAGALKDSIGYGNMNAVMAGLAAFSAIVAFLFIGGSPRAAMKNLFGND